MGGTAYVGILRFHAVNVGTGYGRAEEKFAADHAVVALRLIRGNGALVSPEKVNARPIHLSSKFRGGQKAIEFARRRAAGERDIEIAVFGDALPGPVHNTARGHPGQIGSVGANEYTWEDFTRDHVRVAASAVHRGSKGRRSEEHTLNSSHPSISYAV